MSRWFRLDDDVINDPKILLLPEAMRWIWIAFLCVASKNNGTLPAVEIIALSLRVKVTKATEYRDRLVAAGLIDQTETGFAPHNWDKRQFKSDVSTERVQRFRKQPRNVSETPPHTQTQSEPQKKDAAVAAPDAETDLFRRGREVLGKSAGGMIRQLLTAKDGKVNQARAAIETAAGKNDPREYIGAIIRNRDPPPDSASTRVDPRL